MASKTKHIDGKLRKYAIDQSPFFKLHNPTILAHLFGITRTALERLANLPDAAKYKIFTLKARNDPFSKPRKAREVQEPKQPLAQVHQTIFRFLTRIEVPSYLFSATTGRSYISNAKVHIGHPRAIKMDIKGFFPSVSGAKIFSFFHDRLQCSPDVATLLAKLCTYNKNLPTGSSVSPILSFFAHQSLFDELHKFAMANDLTFSCYVDDVVFSGARVGISTGEMAAKIIERHGLIAHPDKTRLYRKGESRIITGVTVTEKRVLVPHERLRRVRLLKAAFSAELDPKKKLHFAERYIGLLGEAGQIENRFKQWMKAEIPRLVKLRKAALVVPSV